MRILVVASNDMSLYKSRKELFEALLETHEVYLSLPNGEYIGLFEKMGCRYVPCEYNRHGTNPLEELKQYAFYRNLIKEIRPQVVLTYTVKPNIYAGMACASLNVPYIANITGLGTAVENGGLMRKIILLLTSFGLRKAQKVFFQNSSNMAFMVDRKIVKGAYDLLPGSGVNLDEHYPEEYPAPEAPVTFVTVGRIMKDKGADEILYAAKKIHREYPKVVFQLIGGFDGAYEAQVQRAQEEGDIQYLGQQKNVDHYLKNAHALVHASYHEGMANVMLEAAACGRPLIATDVPGCREIYEDGISGIACKARDGEDLTRAIRAFLQLSYEEKERMGLAARKRVEEEFDRSIVVKKYLDEIAKIEETTLMKGDKSYAAV